MNEKRELRHWPDRLEDVLRHECMLLQDVRVLQETDSTQDAARRFGARPGEVVTAWRQIQGRGRSGRSWADTGEDGIAVTICIGSMPADHLMLVSAVATAEAIEQYLHAEVGIKWPNDIIINGRKVAGILIEQHDDVALIGIGINVSQDRWGSELENIAVSLRQLGLEVDRLSLLGSLLISIDRNLQKEYDVLSLSYARRDALVGHRARFRTPAGELEGEVLEVDPRSHIRLRCDMDLHMLPIATCTLLEWHPGTGKDD